MLCELLEGFAEAATASWVPLNHSNHLRLACASRSDIIGNREAHTYTMTIFSLRIHNKDDTKVVNRFVQN